MLGNESSFREDGVGTEDLITTLMTCTKIACRNSVKIEVFPPCHNLCCVKCFTPITSVLGSNYTQFISSFQNSSSQVNSYSQVSLGVSANFKNLNHFDRVPKMIECDRLFTKKRLETQLRNLSFSWKYNKCNSSIQADFDSTFTLRQNRGETKRELFFNHLHPNIGMHILHTVLRTFPRRICLTIKGLS